MKEVYTKSTVFSTRKLSLSLKISKSKAGVLLYRAKKELKKILTNEN